MILDGYLDEPACLGVPPYVSPQVRYLWGVFALNGWTPRYLTVDSWRGMDFKERRTFLRSFDLVCVVMGTSVPGRYLGGSPMNLSELLELLELAGKLNRPALVGGPISRGYALRGGARALPPSALPLPHGVLVRGDLEMSLHLLLREGVLREEATRDYAFVDLVAPLGAPLIREHPNYPYVMCELETGRGCSRSEGCSFCTEPLYGELSWRSPEGVAREVKALRAEGARFFRLGRQSDLLSYMGGRGGAISRPNPAALKELYLGIREAAPDLKVLHMDNGNPLSIISWPEEAREALSVIASHNTPGDVIAFGLESLDPGVAALNRLKVGAEQALEAIRAVNEVGSRREGRSLPKLLPGLNFLVGLAGDSRKTLEHNMAFLERVLEEGLMVRRINLRQAMVFPGTPLEELLEVHPSRISPELFRRWKRRVREEIDREMLRRVAPPGTVLEHALVEGHEGEISFARQIATYPLLAGIPHPLPRGEVLDLCAVGYGYRSITAIPYPLRLKDSTPRLLQAIPGVGRRRAMALWERRHGPLEEALRALDDEVLREQVRGYLT